MSANIDRYLQEAVNKGASDLHLTVGKPPTLRLNGKLYPLGDTALLPEDVRQSAEQLMDESHREIFSRKGEVDLSYSVSGLGRFRVNIYCQRGSTALALRVLNTEIPELDKLGLPDSTYQLARRQKGFVVVTGPTGSGKSTTLAAMINLINQERNCHILTLEDPIEYLHPHGNSLVNQREIGGDSNDFAQALRAALRQDPDVILLGEMRDLETISIAITAAETGHLVFATLHTIDAPQTIDRIIDVFPPEQQQQVRVQLANNLVGVVAQQLLPRQDGGGRALASEVMITNPAIRNLIREGKIYQIYSTMQTSGRQGMQTMDASLVNLYQQGSIDQETAVGHSVDPEEIKKQLGYAEPSSPGAPRGSRETRGRPGNRRR